MLYIIGIGIGGKDSLSKKVLDLIYGATFLVGWKKHLAQFPDFQGERLVVGSDIERLLDALEERHYQGERIVCLATGDPNLFGIAKSIIERFGKEAVEVIPNVSIMQEAFARIKESWEDAGFISLHGRGSKIEGIIDEMAHYDKVGVFTDPNNTPSKIAKALIDNKVTDYKVYVCEDMGTSKEKITEGTLQEISEKDFSSLNVMVLIRGQGAKGLVSGQWSVVSGQKKTEYKESPPSALFGISDSEFSYEKGMITKEEVRSIVLGKLSLRADSILWDIGSGSGAISIEASRIAKEGMVYAVERDAQALKLIEENKRRFNAVNLKVVAGEAPEVLETLPEPDSIFIGGSGGKLREILTFVPGRLKKGGRIVLNFITLENLLETLTILKEKGLKSEVLQVSIARSEELSGKIYFKALNPVFILTLRKP